MPHPWLVPVRDRSARAPPSVGQDTLGDFFAIWRQPLTPTQVGPVSGKLTVFLNGHRDFADPTSILLGSHEDIQIDVGTPVVQP